MIRNNCFVLPNSAVSGRAQEKACRVRGSQDTASHTTREDRCVVPQCAPLLDWSQKSPHASCWSRDMVRVCFQNSTCAVLFPQRPFKRRTGGFASSRTRQRMRCFHHRVRVFIRSKSEVGACPHDHFRALYPIHLSHLALTRTPWHFSHAVLRPPRRRPRRPLPQRPHPSLSPRRPRPCPRLPRACRERRSLP